MKYQKHTRRLWKCLGGVWTTKDLTKQDENDPYWRKRITVHL